MEQGASGGAVDCEGAGAQQSIGGAPPEACADAGAEFTEAERLRDVVIRAGIQAADDACFLIGSG